MRNFEAGCGYDFLADGGVVHSRAEPPSRTIQEGVVEDDPRDEFLLVKSPCRLGGVVCHGGELDDRFEAIEAMLDSKVSLSDLVVSDEDPMLEIAATPRCVVRHNGLEMDALMWAELHEDDIIAAEHRLEVTEVIQDYFASSRNLQEAKDWHAEAMARRRRIVGSPASIPARRAEIMAMSPDRLALRRAQ